MGDHKIFLSNMGTSLSELGFYLKLNWKYLGYIARPYSISPIGPSMPENLKLKLDPYFHKMILLSSPY